MHTRFVLTITGIHADDDDYNEGYYSACIVIIISITVTRMGRGGLSHDHRTTRVRDGFLCVVALSSPSRTLLFLLLLLPPRDESH